MDIYALKNALGGICMEEYADMRIHTTFKAGGKARLLAHPRSEEELQLCLNMAEQHHIPCYVMGNGSNLLVRDGGFPGLMVKLSQGFSEIRIVGSTLFAGAGALMSVAAKTALNNGLMGLEWAAGIPGSVGGAVAMNAGAYGGEIKQVLKRVDAIENGAVHEFTVQEHELGYRRSAYCAPERIVLSAEFELLPDDGGAKERMADYAARRREKQPLSLPSAGSTFKRPEGHFAGALIEQAGLKGMRVGGAEVSCLHAGFIVNSGGATAADITGLIALVQQRVYEHSGVRLEPEIRIIGEEA